MLVGGAARAVAVARTARGGAGGPEDVLPERGAEADGRGGTDPDADELAPRARHGASVCCETEAADVKEL